VSLKIRLSRVGAKKQASYRIVVAESNAPRDGKAIAILGHYNPLTDPYTLKVDEERTIGWLKSGAQPSETARGLLAKAGVIAAYESVRKSSAKPKKAAGDAAEETKAHRTARAQRTEAPRLVRPTRREGAEEVEKPARVTAKKAAAKPAAKGKAGAKASAGKAKPAARKTTASRTTKAKAGAGKQS
jgi:small subunit ribosomal protein S16